MTNTDKPSSPEEDDQRRLMNAISWLPPQTGFWTFGVLAVVTVSGLFGYWEPPYRGLGVVVGVVLLISGACLFYDIPLRRFGRISRAVLWAWIVLSWVVSVYWVLARLLR